MINFCVNYLSLSRAAERNSLGAKREHDNISSVSADQNRYAPIEYSYANALPPLSEIFYNVHV